MKAVVCVKSIKADLFLKDSEKNYAINPYDVFSLKSVKTLKDKTDIEIIALLMGRIDKRISAELKKLGADRIIYLSDSKMAGADTLATTYAISEAVKKIGQVDFVVCGDHSLDGETGHVGAGIAERLNYDYLIDVDSVDINGPHLECTTTEGQYEYKYLVKSGAVITMSKLDLKDITLGLMQLRRMDSVAYEVWDAEGLGLEVERCGLKGSRTKVVGVQQMSEQNCRTSACINIANDEEVSSLLKVLKGEENRVEY